MDREVDFAREGLLDGLEGVVRAKRVELLERLSDEGVSTPELKRAVEGDRLALLPVERTLWSEVRIGSAELARLCGLDPDFVLSVRKSLGLPEVDGHEPVFREADVEAFRALGRLRREALLSDDGMLELVGVVGRGLWRISETALAVVDEAVSVSAENEHELALGYAEAARRLGTAARPLLESAMHAHVREGIREEVVTLAEIRSRRVDDTWNVTVCFVDLVGFTSHSDRLTAEGAHALASGLKRIAASAASPPVRLVKTMGDGAMLVSTEAPPLIEAALEIEGKAAGDDRLPPLRVGISSGEAFARGGDWYGEAVNVASRVVDLAEPGTILATRAARDAAPDGYGWFPAGRARLRGVADEVDLFGLASRSAQPGD